MDILNVASDWIVQGFSVIPIHYKDKKPDANLLPGFQWGIYKTQLPTMDEIRWWFSGPHNIALVTGWNNLVVIDFDNMHVFEIWASLYSLKTFMVKTQRGVHVYLKIAQQVSPQHTDFIDIKAGGGYVLIPPSIHPSGFQYEIYQNNKILEVEKLADVISNLFIPEKKEPAPIEQKLTCMDPWDRASSSVTFSDDLIKKIREQNKIENFFPHAIQSGDHWMKAICPFHNDKSPSFWMTRKNKFVVVMFAI